jgi:hypothetical protein
MLFNSSRILRKVTSINNMLRTLLHKPSTNQICKSDPINYLASRPKNNCDMIHNINVEINNQCVLEAGQSITLKVGNTVLLLNADGIYIQAANLQTDNRQIL